VGGLRVSGARRSVSGRSSFLAGADAEAIRPGDGDVHQALDELGLGASCEGGVVGAELVVPELELLPLVALERIEPSAIAEEPVARSAVDIK
jgi:hypothetical protein